jgi:hypothetical protein
MSPSRGDERVRRARALIRDIERTSVLLVRDAEGEAAVKEADTVMRMAIGLRRKLDLLGGDKHGE